MVSGAPDPVAPFSHAVEADGWVFVTGQMPFTETANDSAYPEGIEAQTCSGQVISDSSIDFLSVDSRSKALGDMLPSFECSLAAL
jgi:hypothetical protein